MKETALHKVLEEIEKEREDRFNYLIENYSTTLTKERWEAWNKDKSIGLHEALKKHHEAVHLIQDVYRFVKAGKMTECKAQELVAEIIEQHTKL